MKQRSAARIERLEIIEAATSPALSGAIETAGGQTTRARVTLSWPLARIGPDLMNLMATISGNLFELREFQVFVSLISGCLCCGLSRAKILDSGIVRSGYGSPATDAQDDQPGSRGCCRWMKTAGYPQERQEKTMTPPQFVGVDNFDSLVSDPQFLGSLRITAMVLAAALVLALALYSIETGTALIVSLLLVPMAIAPIVAGIVRWMLFNARFGAINSILLQWFGIDPVNWTIEMPTALIAIVIAVVWQWTPFVAIILLGGLTTIPRDVLDAARIDGAPARRVLRYIILPMMRPFFLVVGLLMIIEIVRLYELPFFITQGGPGNETVVAGVYLFKLAFSFFDLGRASMMSVFLVISLSVVAALYMRLVADRKASA